MNNLKNVLPPLKSCSSRWVILGLPAEGKKLDTEEEKNFIYNLRPCFKADITEPKKSALLCLVINVVDEACRCLVHWGTNLNWGFFEPTLQKTQVIDWWVQIGWEEKKTNYLLVEVLGYMVPHLSKRKLDLKEKYTQLLTPFSSTVFLCPFNIVWFICSEC